MRVKPPQPPLVTYSAAMNKVFTSAATLLTSGVLIATMAPSAGAAIEPGVGIRGVEIGMRKAEVFAQVGKPSSVRTYNTDFGKYRELRYGKGKKFRVTILARRVVKVWTRSVNQRTPGGLGVGTNTQELLQEVPGIDCRNVTASKQMCVIGEELPGEIVTVFRLRNNTTKSVEIGRVID